MNWANSPEIPQDHCGLQAQSRPPLAPFHSLRVRGATAVYPTALLLGAGLSLPFSSSLELFLVDDLVANLMKV